jgi:hypothetical protein
LSDDFAHIDHLATAASAASVAMGHDAPVATVFSGTQGFTLWRLPAGKRSGERCFLLRHRGLGQHSRTASFLGGVIHVV